MGPKPAAAVVAALWADVGADPAELDDLELSGDRPVLPSVFPVTTAALSAVGATTLAVARLAGELDGGRGRDAARAGWRGPRPTASRPRSRSAASGCCASTAVRRPTSGARSRATTRPRTGGCGCTATSTTTAAPPNGRSGRPTGPPTTDPPWRRSWPIGVRSTSRRRSWRPAAAPRRCAPATSGGTIRRPPSSPARRWWRCDGSGARQPSAPRRRRPNRVGARRGRTNARSPGSGCST